MEEVLKLKEEYKIYRDAYCNKITAIENAMRNLYPGKCIYIYKDSYEDFSHVFIGNHVLFESGCIYEKVK